MIDFTIKTLESINHQFSVEDETTVAQLKEQIRDEMGIEIGMQRLIFCGRVLTDDQRLADFDVNGKVIHLVPRPPPSPQSRSSTHNQRQEMREAMEEAQPHDHAARRPPPARQNWSQQEPPSQLVADQQLTLAMSPVASRLDFIRQILDTIRNGLLLLSQLQNGDDNDLSSEPMDYESSHGSGEQLSNESSVSSETPSPNYFPGQDSGGEGSMSAGIPLPYRPLRPQQPFLTSPRDLANLIEELESLREQFAPYHNAYLAILRDTNTQELSREESTRRRALVEICCDVMHSVSHAYHAASDIEVEFGSVMRLTSGFAINRHPITGQPPPINMLQAGRPIIGQGANRSGPLPSFAAFRAQRLNAAANSGPANTGASDPNTSGQAPGRNPANPESVTYQVEIETRVPIAMPIDADFLGSLASAADQARQRQEQAQAQPQPQTQRQAQTQDANQSNQGQEQEQAQPQARPRFVMDIENLLRTLSQSHPGVEVVMSMEEIHPIGNIAGGAPDFNAVFGNRNPAGGINIGAITSQNILSAASLGLAFDAAQAGLNSSENTGTNTSANNATNTGTNSGSNEGSNSDSFDSRDTSDFGIPGVPMTIFNPETNSSDGISVSIGGIRMGGHRYAVNQASSNLPPEGPEGTVLTPGVPVNAFGPSTITMQPDGSLFIAPMASPNNTASGPSTETLHSLFPSMFRPVNVTTDAASAAPNSATGADAASNNSGNATNAAPSTSNPVPSFTPAPNANQNTTQTNTARPAGAFWTMSANAANAAPSASNPVPSFTPASNANQNTTQTNTARAIEEFWTMSPNAAPSASNPVPSFTPAPNANQNTTQSNTARPVGGLWTMSANAASNNSGNTANAASSSNAVPSFTPASNAYQNNIARAGMPLSGERTRNQQQVNSRIHELAMACMVYDRFLDCDSQHARRRVQEYRAVYQELYSEQVRRRSNYRSAASIYHMERRSFSFTTRHMAVMMRLLSGPSCPEARLNAFMVTVGRMVILTRNLQNSGPMSMPREFVSIRVHIREYILGVIQTVFNNDGVNHLFEAVTNVIISHHQAFLDRMHELAPINPEINAVIQIREFVRSRIPMIIACAISRSTSETFVGRFYNVFLRFYMDMCTMVQEFCVNGFEGLRALYTTFFDQITENYEQTACDWLRLMVRVTLDEIQPEIDPLVYQIVIRGGRRPVVPTSTPPPPPPRYDTPETLESLPSTSIPTMSSASSTSDSAQYDDDQSISPVLGADASSNISHNSVPRSPVETQSACASPHRDTPISQSGNNLPTQSAQPTNSGQPTQSAQPAQTAVPVASASFALGQNVLGQHTLIALPSQSDSPTQIEQLAQSGQTLLNFLGAHSAQAAQSGQGPSSFEGHSGQAASGQGSGSQSGQPGQSRPGISKSTGALSGQTGQSGQNGEGQGTRRPAPKSAPSTAPSTPPPTIPSVRLHWDEQWAPVFSRDHRLQRERERAQEPFSDAYLCGMPSRKRRCVRNSRPPTSLDGFMNETVREATDRAASLDTTQIRTCLLDSVRSILRTRSDTSEDYDPVRFSATARFIEGTKPNTPEPDSTPDEKAEGKAEEKME